MISFKIIFDLQWLICRTMVAMTSFGIIINLQWLSCRDMVAIAADIL